MQLAKRIELQLLAGSCGPQAGAQAEAQQELGWLPAAWKSLQVTGAAQGASYCCSPPCCALTAHQMHCCTRRCSASPQQMLPLPTSQGCSAQQASPAGLQQLAVLLRGCGHLWVAAAGPCQQPPAKHVAGFSRCLPAPVRRRQWFLANGTTEQLLHDWWWYTNNSPALQQVGRLPAEAATAAD